MLKGLGITEGFERTRSTADHAGEQRALPRGTELAGIRCVANRAALLKQDLAVIGIPHSKGSGHVGKNSDGKKRGASARRRFESGGGCIHKGPTERQTRERNFATSQAGIPEKRP